MRAETKLYAEEVKTVGTVVDDKVKVVLENKMKSVSEDVDEKFEIERDVTIL